MSSSLFPLLRSKPASPESLNSKPAPERRRGFTLVETLVAVSILGVVLAAVLTAAHAALSASITSQNKVTAFFLAQEILEDVKTLRDKNNAEEYNWLEGFIGSDECGNKWCVVDKFDEDLDLKDFPKFSNCGSGVGGGGQFYQCDPVKRQKTEREVIFDNTLAGGTETQFTRAIKASATAGSGNDPYAVELTVKVEWQDKGDTRSIEIIDYIYDWQ